VQKITLKTYDFGDISNTVIPTTLGGSTTTSPLIVIVILRQQLDYVCVYLYIIDYGRAVHAAPDKSYVLLFQETIIIYFSPHPTLGGSAMKNHLAYH
jgi:hypothetical protein